MPKGITVKWYRSQLVVNTVSFLSSWCFPTCQYPFFKCKVENHVDPEIMVGDNYISSWCHLVCDSPHKIEATPPFCLLKLLVKTTDYWISRLRLAPSFHWPFSQPVFAFLPKGSSGSAETCRLSYVRCVGCVAKLSCLLYLIVRKLF